MEEAICLPRQAQGTRRVRINQPLGRKCPHLIVDATSRPKLFKHALSVLSSALGKHRGQIHQAGFLRKLPSDTWNGARGMPLSGMVIAWGSKQCS